MNKHISAPSVAQMLRERYLFFLNRFTENDGLTVLKIDGRSAFILEWLYIINKSDNAPQVLVSANWQAFPAMFVNHIGNPAPLSKQDPAIQELVSNDLVELETPYETRLRITAKGVSLVEDNTPLFCATPSELDE